MSVTYIVLIDERFALAQYSKKMPRLQKARKQSKLREIRRKIDELRNAYRDAPKTFLEKLEKLHEIHGEKIENVCKIIRGEKEDLDAFFDTTLRPVVQTIQCGVGVSDYSVGDGVILVEWWIDK